MNHSSLRASPGGSSALSRHCTRRCVFVNVPSFSRCDAAGMRNTSVAHSSGRSFQKLADSISARSRTTSHFRCRSARLCSPACWDPTTGFCPMQTRPSSPPSSARSIVGKCEWFAEIFGSEPNP